MQHLDEGTIHAWLDGALDDLESARVARHAAECSACAALVAEARGLIAGASRIVSSLDVVRGGVIPPAAAPATPRGATRVKRSSPWNVLRLTPVRTAIAATVLVAAGSMLAVRGANRGDLATAKRAAANDAASPAQMELPAPAAPVPMAVEPPSASSADKDLRRRGVATADNTNQATSAKQAAPASRSEVDRVARGGAAGGAAPLRQQEAVAAADVASRAPQESRKVSAAAATVPSAAPSQLPSPVSTGAASQQQNRPANEVASQIAAQRQSQAQSPAPFSGRATGAVAARETSLAVVARDSVTLARRDLQSNFAPLSKSARDSVNAVAGCYSVVGDLPAWAAVIPPQFALDTAPVSNTTPQLHAVREGAGQQKLDTVRKAMAQRNFDAATRIASWRLVPTAGATSSTVVTWPGSPNDVTLTLDVAPFTTRATISDVAHTQPIAVTRAPCTPR